MNVEIQNGSGRSGWVTVERMLLVAVILLQAGILVWLYNDHRRGRSAPEKEAPMAIRSGRTIVIPSPPPAPRVRRDPGFWPDALLLDPLEMHARMNRMMQEAFDRFEHRGNWVSFDDGWDDLVSSPAMDLRETDTDYEVSYSLPGLAPSNLTVSIEGRVLTVRTSDESTAPGTTSSSRFESRVQLPGPVDDASQAQTAFTNGVLKITVPKSRAARVVTVGTAS